MNSKKIDLKELLKEKKKIALGGHVRPDGDCIGSVMGLYLYLKQEYPHIQTDVYLEKIPETFRLIKGTDEVRSEVNNNETPYDLFICLDCADPMRLGFSSSIFENAKETVCIDHHISNESFADLNYIVPDASSTSELVVTLLDEEKISKESAEALYMGIAHDTGVFRYSCTSPETMENAAKLMRKGINGNAIIEQTFYEKTYVQNQILGRALLESMLIMDRQCVVSVIRKSSMEFFHAEPSDLEGVVSILRQTKGVEVAIFLHELEPQKYKVSLRSKQYIDVSVIAKHFGGGGHIRAAGVTMTGSAHDVINNITGFIFIGKEFGAKTVYTSMLLPVYLWIFEHFIPLDKSITNEQVIDLVIYVLLIALGQALLFHVNASSGGLDIVAKMLNKFTHIEIGKALTISGLITAMTSIFVYDIPTLIISLLGTYANGAAVDYFIDGFKKRKRVCIIADDYRPIQQYIIHDLNRGATLYTAQGAYDETHRTELITIITQQEYRTLLNYLHSCGQKVFVTVSTVNEVIGQWNSK